MSWEIDWISEIPCDCGAGTFERIHSSNDWIQTDEALIIHCEICRAARNKVRERRHELKQQIQSLVVSRYFEKWLALFEGMNKKQAWFRLTQGGGYPSLGTFYKHVKDRGVEEYLTRTFHNDVGAALSLAGVVDDEISRALAELDTLPDYDNLQRRLPH